MDSLIKNKNFLVFENCIKKIIDIYENHKDYIEKDISITRIMAWQYKNNVIDDLLNLKEFDNIKNKKKILNIELQMVQIQI